LRHLVHSTKKAVPGSDFLLDKCSYAPLRDAYMNFLEETAKACSNLQAAAEMSSCNGADDRMFLDR